MSALDSVLFVGGTHGNELTGVRFVEQWPLLASRLERANIEIDALMANPLAVERSVRFVDFDLNRQFSLMGPQPDNAENSNEHNITGALKQQLSSLTGSQPDLIIDIHNTTSAMGATLILVDDDKFNQQLARYVAKTFPKCNILLENEKPYAEHPYLCTLGKRGIMIEMGAQPQGVCRADIFEDSLGLLDVIMDFCALWNAQSVPDLAPCNTFQFIENIGFPLSDNGLVKGVVHTNLQDNDFLPLEPGQAIFSLFDGTEVVWQGEQTVYPHFINEAAYQKTDVAFAIAKRITW